ncbi:MAG: AAA family ATPase [Gammaproteobacteria bacterium]|nr:AAA family ATPase [Gammaproteobacteria bacterium]
MNDANSATRPADGSEVGLDEILALEQRSHRVIEDLRDTVFAPDGHKTLDRRFPISEASTMVGRAPQTIRDAERAGKLAPPEKDAHGRRIGYSLEQINTARAHFGTLPYRNPETDEPVICAVQNFKGGVGKSTIAVHLAQYLGLRGYRVLVVDCDPQASTTSLFGLNPDYDLDEDSTLRPFMRGEMSSLSYALRDSYFPQLKLLPSNLSNFDLEYELAARLPENPNLLDRLRVGLSTVTDQFDVVVIDPPPALGLISLSVTRAANALIVPTRPATIDFGSTAHFFTMLCETLQILSRHGYTPSYKFVRMLANDVDESKSAHGAITEMMKRTYGHLMLNTVMKDSAEIDNAGGSLMTVYELSGPRTSRATHNRCKAYLDAVNREIEIEIQRTWPSCRQLLSQEGLL